VLFQKDEYTKGKKLLVVVFVKGTLMTKQETFAVKGTVLLVDDDPMFCTVTEALLESLGFTVFVAVGGNEAVVLFQKYHNSIDCLLTDLSMPDMNGWEKAWAVVVGWTVTAAVVWVAVRGVVRAVVGKCN
jgi:FixJ family two-component response regulator